MADRRRRSAQKAEASVDDFLRDIEQSGAVPTGLSPQEAVSGVLCALTLRIEAGEARDFLVSMPPTVQQLISRCVHHRDEHAAVFERSQFLRLVGDHLGLGQPEAESVARAVLAAVQTWLPRSQQDDVRSQLPPDIEALWPPVRAA
jgi:uncharacterized protein (DUF2267 family)